MDERSLSDLFSKLVPDELEEGPVGGMADSEEREGLLIEALRLLAGQPESSMANALNEFLDGKGVLLERTRSAVTRGGKTATSEVADFLKEHFNLSASVAKTVATLLVRLFPSIGKLTGEKPAAKPKPRRKTQPKASSGKKPASSSKSSKRKTPSSGKATKRRASTSAKPAASSQPKKRKTASTKKPATASKPSKRRTSTGAKSAASSKSKRRGTATRSVEIPSGEET